MSSISVRIAGGSCIWRFIKRSKNASKSLLRFFDLYQERILPSAFSDRTQTQRMIPLSCWASRNSMLPFLSCDRNCTTSSLLGIDLSWSVQIIFTRCFSTSGRDDFLKVTFIFRTTEETKDQHNVITWYHRYDLVQCRYNTVFYFFVIVLSIVKFIRAILSVICTHIVVGKPFHRDQTTVTTLLQP